MEDILERRKKLTIAKQRIAIEEGELRVLDLIAEVDKQKKRVEELKENLIKLEEENNG